MAIPEKRYFVRVYDRSGNYITTWEDAAFDGFTKIVNGGLGELNITLARPRNDFGEGEDVNLGNRVDVTVWDRETDADGLIIYSGFISTYSPNLPGESVGIKCFGYSTELSSTLYRDGDIMTITHNSTDPTVITADILEKFTARNTTNPVTWELGALDSLNYTGQNVSYTYGLKYCNEAIDKTVRGLAPANWYWYWPASNRFIMRRRAEGTDHRLIIGQHITGLESPKTTDELWNVYVFWNNKEVGDPDYLFDQWTLSGSVSAWGFREYKNIDGRVTDSITAGLMANAFLEEHGAPLVTIRVSIADSNGAGDKGYDIESIEPGDTVSIDDPEHFAERTLWDVAQWDEDMWDFALEYIFSQPLIVTKVDYTLDEVQLELSTRAPSLAKRITELNRKIDQLLEEDSPTSL